MYNPLVFPSAGVAVMGGADGQSRPSGAVFDDSSATIVIDGTPMRVVMIAGAAALTVAAFRWAGFRFNVGVSS